MRFGRIRKEEEEHTTVHSYSFIENRNDRTHLHK